MPRTSRRVAIYARLSVATEESVSIERQLEAGRQLALARGWTVVLERQDDGVSATRNKPEDRVGWRQILETDTTFDAVIIWKVDRLARKTLDFLNADAALSKRGAGIVAVDDPVDMTTAQGRAFATLLAVFAELEAASISARVKAARRTILSAGRRVGGRPPFGWMNVPNPDGPGMVLAKDPERILVVEDLVRRAIAGESLYSMARSLEADGVVPRSRQTRTTPVRWHEASVETILRAPTVAGMTPYNPDYNPHQKPRKPPPTEVLRDADGLPVIDESVAILSREERRALLATLDAAKRPGTRQKAGAEPALLYGIVRCGSCGGLLYRATAAGKYKQYRCQHRSCTQQVGVAREALEEHVVDRVLEERGSEPTIIRVPNDPGPDVQQLDEIEFEIRRTSEAIALAEEGEEEALMERLTAQKRARTAARAGVTSERSYRASRTLLREDWEGAATVEDRRQLLLGHIEAVYIKGAGRRGRGFDSERVEVAWRQVTDEEAAQHAYRDDVMLMRAWRRPS